MKKTMLKRSLALGALMAFVITGSAMAEKHQINNFESIDKEVTNISEFEALVYYDHNNTVKEVNKDVVYREIVNVSDNNAHTNKVLGQGWSTGGTNLTFNGNVTIEGISNSARNLTGQGATFGIDMYDGVLTFNGDSTNIYVESTGEGQDSAISVTGIQLWGYGSSDNEKNKANLVFAGKDAEITVIGNDSSEGTVDREGLPGIVDGIYIAEDAKLTVKNDANVKITAISNGTEDTSAIRIEGGMLESEGNIIIDSTSANGIAYGIKASNKGWTATSGTFNSDTNLSFNGNTDITVKGDSRAYGVYVEKTSNDDLTVSFDDYVTNVAVSANEIARGVAAVNGATINLNSKKINIGISTENGVDNPSIGIWSWKKGSQVNVGDNVEELNIVGTQKTTGSMYGIIAQNNTTESKDTLAEINVNAQNVNIALSDTEGNAAGNALVAMSQGILNVNSNLYVNAENAIVARGNAQVRVNTDSDKATQLNGNISFNYDEKTSGTPVDAKVNVNLIGADSYWNGNSKVSWDSEKPVDVDKLLQVTGLIVSLNDGAQWNPEMVAEEGEAGVSNSGTMYTAVNKLNLNDGIINIDVAKTRDQAIEVENLAGDGGTVNFTVDTADGELTTGLLHVDDSDSSTKVAARFRGIDADDVVTKENFAGLVHNALEVGGGAEFTAYVDEGLLTPAMSGVTTNSLNGNTIEMQNIQQGKSTTTMDSMRDIASTAIIAWRQEDSTLSQRLGELRNSEGDQGVWVRMSRGEFEYNGAFKNQYNYFQMGYDKAYGDWHYGAAISHNDGETVYDNGKGDNRSTSLSLYGTWLGNHGQYVDIVLKQGRLSNEFEIHTAAGDTRGDYDAWGTSLSGEYGVKLDMADGWYVTPQAQMTFMRIGGEDYTTNNDIRVSQDTLYSTVGRVGFELGKQIMDEGSVYAKASVLHEFAGDADTYLRLGDLHNSYSQDIGNTWYETSLGFNYKASANSYVYADVVKTFGDDFKTPWQWNVGMRWSF